MKPPRKLGNVWKRTMMRNTIFAGNDSKLRLLYSLEDPWGMASEREQYRFTETNSLLSSISPRYGRLLEIGCGEGSQSVHLSSLTDQLYGIDISSRAIGRARQRCPEANFTVASMDEVPAQFDNGRFDLITTCEVFYYARELTDIIPQLQAMTDRLFVSNYEPIGAEISEHFIGPGWRDLGKITHPEAVWGCAVWEAPDLLS